MKTLIPLLLTASLHAAVVVPNFIEDGGFEGQLLGSAPSGAWLPYVPPLNPLGSVTIASGGSPFTPESTQCLRIEDGGSMNGLRGPSLRQNFDAPGYPTEQWLMSYDFCLVTDLPWRLQDSLPWRIMVGTNINVIGCSNMTEPMLFRQNGNESTEVQIVAGSWYRYTAESFGGGTATSTLQRYGEAPVTFATGTRSFYSPNGGSFELADMNYAVSGVLLVDNVAVGGVPEPSVALMLCIGALFFLSLRARGV